MCLLRRPKINKFMTFSPHARKSINFRAFISFINFIRVVSIVLLPLLLTSSDELVEFTENPSEFVDFSSKISENIVKIIKFTKKLINLKKKEL